MSAVAFDNQVGRTGPLGRVDSRIDLSGYILSLASSIDDAYRSIACLNIFDTSKGRPFDLSQRWLDDQGLPVIRKEKELSILNRVISMWTEAERMRPESSFSSFQSAKDRYRSVLQLVHSMVMVKLQLSARDIQVNRFDPSFPWELRHMYHSLVIPDGLEINSNGQLVRRGEDKALAPDEKISFQVAYNGANFVSPFSGITYILMQGPLDTTIGLTREMMQQNEVSQIVCLTQAFEEGQEKCFDYWRNWSIHPKEDVPYSLRRPGESQGWPDLTMYHYEKWPDRQSPDIVEFIRLISDQRKAFKKGAVVIHCSAGLGRTGVYMIATLMIEMLEKDPTLTILNPVQLCSYIRKFRVAVHTSVQLEFCYKIAEYLLAQR